jgi:hypothetical protein
LLAQNAGYRSASARSIDQRVFHRLPLSHVSPVSKLHPHIVQAMMHETR